MERIVIALKIETKRKLKSQAALKGMTLKKYVLWSTGLLNVEKGNNE